MGEHVLLQRGTAQLEAGLARIRESPRDGGRVELIVRRPAVDERELLAEAELDVGRGLVGDGWDRRSSRLNADGGPDPDRQLTMMNARAIALIAADPDRWALAGDQLYVDLDLGPANLPTGTRLAVGSAELEVTAPPHTGCAKFSARFGVDALRFVGSRAGRELRLRGMYARVVRGGTVRAGDRVRKVAARVG